MRPLSTSTRSSLAFLSHSILPFPLSLSPNCISPLVEPVTITCRDSLSQFSLPKVVELSSLSTDPISSRTKISRSLARLIHLPSNDTRITNVDNLIATILGQCKSFFSFFFYSTYPTIVLSQNEGGGGRISRTSISERKRGEKANGSGAAPATRIRRI